MAAIPRACAGVGKRDRPPGVKRAALLLVAALPGGCERLPRDVDGVSDRIAGTHAFTVGMAGDGGAAGKRLLSELSARTGATPRLARGPMEPLLLALEDGRLDLVIAPFAADTPWATRVALAPPLAASGKDKTCIEWRAAARNGENQWVMTVEKASRTVADPGAAK